MPGKFSFFIVFTVFLFLIPCTNSCAQEICNNGIDDDGDGLVDLQDPDCSCHFDVTGNLLQNASFEAYKNCPTNYSYTNDYDIVNYWQYGTYTNINVANYYHNFGCSYDSSLVMLYIPPSLPLPDGNAFISIRQNLYRNPQMQETDIAKAYIGQCLQVPLVPSRKYTISFTAGRFKSNDDATFKFKNEPFTVAIFGNPDCNAAPFGQAFVNSNGCPANYAGWIELGKVTMYSKGRWVQNKINFTVPYNINLVEIGPDCSLLNFDKDLPDSTTRLDFYVYYLDDLHLLPTTDFHFQYINIDSGDVCEQDSKLTVPYSPNSTYQWYRDSIAIPGATGNIYELPSNNRNGNYNVRISNNITCTVSEPYTVAANSLATLSLPADTSFCKNDTLVLAPAINGIVYNVNGRSDSVIEITAEGAYYVVASDSKNCTKTFNVIVHKNDCLTNKLFIPNSFTPNGDGKNDVFRIPPELRIKILTFSIYDRWGNIVYNGNATTSQWDGHYNGKACAGGAYVYIITAIVDNSIKRIRGTVFLIR